MNKVFVRTILERKNKEVHLSKNRTTECGSDEHVSDLEARINDACYWRTKYPRGSAKRSYYSNIINHLKSELHTAKKRNQKLNEKQVTNESLFLEGGLVGHLMHLYDNRSLTFEEIKSILKTASTGRLQKVSEKMDGMNLVFSYDASTDQIKVTRGADIRRGGMDAESLAKKFSGRGSVEEAFVKAFRVLEGAIMSLPNETKMKVFGDSANFWYSIEIIYTKNPNVINYDENSVVFHGWPVFKKEGENVEMSEDTQGGIDILSTNIEKMQAAVSASGWRVRGPSIIQMRDISNGTVYEDAVAKINSAISQAGISDKETVGDYLRVLLESDLENIGLPEGVSRMVVSRCLEEDGAPTVTEIKKNSDKSFHATISEFVKNSSDLFKSYIRPIELAINDFASEVLKGLESTLVSDSGTEIQRIRDEVRNAIQSIESSGEENSMQVLQKQLEKLKSVENITSPMEGVVFIYKGNAYKFTGSFAAVNQILGIFKYGRGSKKTKSTN